jgi:uncharacterized RDD family membrane protein YckC
VRLAAAPAADSGDTTPYYPGKRFGIPPQGPGSIAPMGRRLLALIIDWVLCELIVSAVTHHSVTRVNDSAYLSTQDWTTVACFLELYVLTALSGLTVGKRLLGIRVIRTDGGRPGFGWAALRTLLLFFVIPPLLADRDMRGMHDRACDTIVVRMPR